MTNAAKNTDTLESMMAEMARLKAENEALRAKPSTTAKAKAPKHVLSISPKGFVHLSGFSMYGLTLYPEQAVWLCQNVRQLEAFVKAMAPKLSWKHDEVRAQAEGFKVEPGTEARVELEAEEAAKRRAERREKAELKAVPAAKTSDSPTAPLPAGVTADALQAAMRLLMANAAKAK